MANSIQLNSGIEISRHNKERQEQRFLSYVRKCAEKREAKEQAEK